MASGQIGKFLEFANLQLAAESFLTRVEDPVPNQPPPDQIRDRLVEGNFHASKFTVAQADQFTDPDKGYEILAQYRNDPLLAGGAGFSGTLFRNRRTRELTLSLRSSEFIDDAVRDGQATNALEVRDLGWAFSQIAEMEAWYAQLRADPTLLGNQMFNITGYSLGGHLATAFSILRREAAERVVDPEPNPILNVYTFNGAGTGEILNGRRLTELVADFNRIRADFAASREWTSLSLGEQNNYRTAAQRRIDAINDERFRIAGLTGVTRAFSVSAPTGAQTLLGNQIAALLVSSDTRGAFFTNPLPTEPVLASRGFRNMIETVGMEADGLATSFVSNSGVHYGLRQEVPIEGQPTFRGDFPLQFFDSVFKLVVNNPNENDFADTHSLVLVVDSLSLSAELERLDPQFSLEAASQIFAAASNAKVVTSLGTQGKAEGDTLEKILDSLRRLLLDREIVPTPASLDGGTWRDLEQRQAFHQNLAEVSAAISTNNDALAGKFRIVPLAEYTVGEILGRVGDDTSVGAAWRYAIANLNPFVIEPTTATVPEAYRSARYAIFDPAMNPNGLSADYLADRATFLSWKVKQNTANLTASRARESDAALFDDRTSGYKAYVLPRVSSNPDRIPGDFDRLDRQGRARFVTFGRDDDDEALRGRDRNDRLYGGGGSDELFGGGGTDYLEGGDGSDFLYGQAGDRDVLVGGTGDDVLDGGPGDDTLNGGADRDLYLYTSGEGTDTILDSDGLGTIRFSTASGIVDLRGGAKIGPDLWESADKQFRYALVREVDGTDTLNVLHGKDHLVLEDFTPGKLGINLEGLTQPPPLPSNERFATPGNETEFYGDGAHTAGFHIHGLAGDDFLIVFPVNEGLAQEGSVVEGEADNDALSGGSGADRLFVGSADDLQGFLEGTASTVPGLNREVALGNKGDDLLVGSSGNDWLGGGLGKDTIYGGAGDDVISGIGDAYFFNIGEPLPQNNLIFNVHDSALSGVAVLPFVTAAAAGDRIIRQGLDDQSPLDDKDIVFAGAGNDEVWGGYGDDELLGEGGSDTIRGEEGNDVIFGGDGADVLRGDGEQVALGLQGDDFLDGGAGEDVLYGQGGTDHLYGGDDRDILNGDAGNDALYGEAGNDDLFGGAGNDTLVGGTGDDLLMGGAGDDTYVIEADGGQDTIVDSEGANRFVFGPGVSAGSLNLSRVATGNQLVVQYGTSNTLTIDGGFADTGQQFEFADGALYDLQQILSVADTVQLTLTGQGTGATVLGGSGNDTLTAGASDRLEGGRGDDTLIAALQSTFAFSSGDGNDVVTGATTGAGYAFDESVDPATAFFVRADPSDPRRTSPRDLVLHYGDGDSILIRDTPYVQFNNYTFEQNGSLLTHIALLDRSGLELLWEGAGDDDFASGTSHDDQLSGQGGEDTLQGLAGDDTLDGGAGKDTLEGGAGADMLIGGTGADILRGGADGDVYWFSLEDGEDVVEDSAGSNTVLFGQGITPGQISGDIINSTDGNTYFALSITGNDALFLRQSFPDNAGGEFSFQFDNGPVLSQADFAAQVLSFPLDFVAGSNAVQVTGSRFDDNFVGSDRSDRITGGRGNDRMDGQQGDDLLRGGADADAYVLRPGMGRDSLVEEGTEINTLELTVDLSPDDFNAGRTGDDLLLTIKNSRDGVRIRNYFTDGGAWQFRSPNGTLTPLADAIGTLDPVTRAATVEAAFSEFRERIKSYLKANFLQNGFVQTGLDQYHRETVEEGIIGTSPTAGYRFYNVSDFLVATLLQTSDAPFIFRSAQNWQGLASTRNEYLVQRSFHELNTTGSRFVSYADGGNRGAFANTSQTRPYFIDLNATGSSGFSFALTSAVVPVMGPNGSLAGFAVYPAGALGPGGAPEYDDSVGVQTNIDTTRSFQVNIQEIIAGTAGNTIATRGLSLVDGGAGDDTISATDGFAFLPDNLGVLGFYPTGAVGALLYGNDGNDDLRGSPRNDVLIGGAGDDSMDGDEGNDEYVLFPGDGLDRIYERRRQVELGSRIPEPVLERDNVVVLPDGVRSSDLDVSWEAIVESGAYMGQGGIFNPEMKSLYAAVDISWGTSDEVRIVVPHSDQDLGTGIEQFRFFDGSVMTFNEVVAPAPGFDANPQDRDNSITVSGVFSAGAGNDVLAGAETNDTLIGDAGRDRLSGGAGDDDLFGGYFYTPYWEEGDEYEGGPGDDRLVTTAGADLIEFGLGDGYDIVTDAAHADFNFEGGFAPSSLLEEAASNPSLRQTLINNQDTLRFGPGISPQDIWVYRAPSSTMFEALAYNFDYLVFGHRNGSDAVRFQNWYMTGSIYGYPNQEPYEQLSRVEFEDYPDTVWDRATIQALAANAPRPAIGSGSSDFLVGSDVNDQLSGLAGNDTLVGGLGNDVLDGGAGDDTYFFQPGDGVDTIQESGIGEFDVLSFGFGITPDMLTLDLGSLLIRIGDNGDAVHIAGFDPNDALDSGTIESFRFSGDVNLSYAELLSLGLDIKGTFADDVLTGTSVQDRMFGLGGNDVISSAEGEDRIDGGSGNDLLLGGADNDTYVFAGFSGTDRIEDSGGDRDVLELGGGITADETAVLRSGNLMRLLFGAGRGGVDIRWQPQAGYRIERVEFKDGATWDAATLESLAEEQANFDPVVSAPIEDQTVQEDALYTFHIPPGTFSDPGDALTCEVSLPSGAALPAWLSFDPIASRLSGTPRNEDVGSIEVRVTAIDSGGLSVFDTYRLTVANTNDAPTRNQRLQDHVVAAGTAFGYAIAEEAFSDVDVGDNLTFTAALSDGSALPQWLEFDSQTHSFRGTSPVLDAGELSVRVRATDTAHTSVEGVFALTVMPAQQGGEAGETDAPDAALASNTGAVSSVSAPSIEPGDNMETRLSASDDVLAKETEGLQTVVGHNAPDTARLDSAERGVGPLDTFIAQTSHFQLEPPIQDQQRLPLRDPELSAVEIARRWDAIARHSDWLATHHETEAEQGSALVWQLEQSMFGNGEYVGGMSYGGIAGVGIGAADLQVLRGLAEGVQQLSA